MAITIGCADLNKNCDYRITAGDDETELVVDTTSAHALKYHPEMASDEPSLREAIKSHIRSLMRQSHTDAETQAEFTQ